MSEVQYDVYSNSLNAFKRIYDNHHSKLMQEIGKKNFLGQTALHTAVIKPKHLEYLLDQLDQRLSKIIDVGDRDDTTPLMYAAAYGQAQSVLVLLKSGANPCLGNRKGETFVSLAILRHHVDLVIEAIEFYHSSDKSGAACWLAGECFLRLLVAVPSQRMCGELLTVLRQLVDLGADLGQVTQSGNTPVHFARYAEEAYCLLDLPGLTLNAVNKRGVSPLMSVSWFGDPHVVKKLLNYSGVSTIDVCDRSGRSALQHALGSKNDREIWIFDYKGYDFHTPWISRFQTSNVLLQTGATPVTQDRCICYCSYRRNEEITDEDIWFGEGCTSIRQFLGPIYRSTYRASNLAAIPWLLELFKLVERYGTSEDLRFLLMSLLQRQAFDELGMTHTCCVAELRGWKKFCPSHTPFSAALDDEREACRTRKMDSAVVDDDDEDDEDLNAIRAEQSHLAKRLLEKVTRFDKSIAAHEPGEHFQIEWIKLLARRVVFLECGMAKAVAIDEEEHQKKSSTPIDTRIDDAVSLLPSY